VVVRARSVLGVAKPLEKAFHKTTYNSSADKQALQRQDHESHG